jgi:hypothetical protein
MSPEQQKLIEQLQQDALSPKVKSAQERLETANQIIRTFPEIFFPYWCSP